MNISRIFEKKRNVRLCILAAIMHITVGTMLVHLLLPQVGIIPALIGVAFWGTFPLLLAATTADFELDAESGELKMLLSKPILAFLCLNWFAGAVPVLVGSYAVRAVRRCR